MKRTFILVVLLLTGALTVFAQASGQKTYVDAMNRVILDGTGKRIVYREDAGKSRYSRQEITRDADGDGQGITTIALCSPQWFQGTMGACIGLNSMITEDIDHDGQTEIICGAGGGYGSGHYWYVMKYNASLQAYEQTWMSSPIDYPYSGTPFTCIRAFDTDNDNIFEIFIGYQDGKVEIYKGLEMNMTGSFDTGGGDVNDILFADADNDGQKEIVLCDDADIYLYNISNLTKKATLAHGSEHFAAGNVDADPRIEIVCSNGTVLDLEGTTLVVEWNIYSPLLEYALVSLTDTDNDGMDEVIIGKPWQLIEVFDADTKTLKGTIPTDIDVDAMIVADVTGDGKKEILYGDGQWGSVHCCNAQSFGEMWSIPNPEHGVTQVGVADVDGDSQSEVIWGAGCSSSGPDYLYVHDIANQAFEYRSEDLTGPFYDVETGDVDGDGQDEIVTVSYQSQSGYEGGILSIFDGQSGDLKWQCDGDFFPGTWEGIHCLELANVTGDGTKEIIVAADHYYDGVVYIVSGITHQVISSKIFSTEGIDGILGLDVADVDNDGAPELVMPDDKGLFIVNPSTFAVEWSTLYVGGYSTKTAMTGNVEGGSNPEVVICKDMISTYDLVTNNQWSCAERNCTNIDLYDWDNDGFLEIIACTDDGKILEMDRQTGLTSLLLQSGTARIDGVRAVNLDGAGVPELIFTRNGKIFFATVSGDILSTLAFGPEAGRFDALKLSDVNNDGILEIYAGTRCQVVQVSEECSQCLGFKAGAGGTKASCVPGNDGTATVTLTAGNAPFTYQWNNGSTLQSISGLAPGEYVVQVSDSKGCLASDTVTILQSVIDASIAGKDIGCKGMQDGRAGISIITGTPPYQYAWSNGGTLQSIAGLAPGTYSCTVTDLVGCAATRSVTLLKDTLKINLETMNPPCFGYGGRGIVEILSGVSPFTYLWNGAPGNSINYNLPGGTNTLVVTDTLNCSASRQFTITVPSQIFLSTSFVPDDPLTPGADGQATVTATGGTPPYYYQWNDPFHQTNSTATNLEKGHYVVSVYDYAGCHQVAGVDLYGLPVDEKGSNPLSLEVFPNPVSDVLNVTVGGSVQTEGIITLVNASGNVIERKSWNSAQPGEVVFGVKGLPASLYLVVLQTGRLTLTQRVVVTRQPASD